ncbi:unnamed protein product [Cyclocybe aegerita]|uniref:Uncharacterized protein n=1 Tax=Cyclocybe aegerita TaxID=1973307 RepID=A0A8S0WA59_CYCAE|nr:unnamed protein product [Cyclocybe aegerita]
MPALLFDPAFLEPISPATSPECRKQIVAHIRDMYHVCTVLQRRAAQHLLALDNMSDDSDDDDDDDDSAESEVDELVDDSTAAALADILSSSGSGSMFIQDWASLVLRPVPENRYSAFVRLLRGYYPADDVAQASTVLIELPENHVVDTCCRQTLAIVPMENLFERLQAHEIIMDTRLPTDALYIHKSMLALVKLVNAILFASCGV